jgi:predicted RNA-binding Zn-ribbon protein involved in translation (DUF1610 family)
MSEKKEIVYKNMVYYCPVCGSKKITMNMSAVLNKQTDANPYRMSNKEKALAYNSASTEGVGCWNYECRKCGWISETLVE